MKLVEIVAQWNLFEFNVGVVWPFDSFDLIHCCIALKYQSYLPNIWIDLAYSGLIPSSPQPTHLPFSDSQKHLYDERI